MKSVGWLLRGMAASLHSLCGWLAYRIGCRASARRHFERVLLLRGADFRAYVQLGRIAFDHGDYASWRREFEHARRLDPHRFARLRHPLELFEPRLAGTNFDRPAADQGLDGGGARATWRTLRTPGAAPGQITDAGLGKTGIGDTTDGLDALLPGCDERTEQPPRFVGRMPSADGSPRQDGDAAGRDQRSQDGSQDDCVSAAERRRFLELGPIAADELRRCDLDDLLRRLSG
jgi:hypothetical protein